MSEEVKRITASDSQVDFLELKTKFRAFVGGYGSGKTFIGCTSLIKKECDAISSAGPVKLGYFAPTYTDIRDIFYPTIEEVAFLHGITTDIKTGNKEVYLRRGRVDMGMIICRSMDNPGSIVGFEIAHALVDELDVLPAQKAEVAWRKIIARMRQKKEGMVNSIDVTTTPEGFKTTHKLFMQRPTEKPELKNLYGLVNASTYENKDNLPEDYIQSLVDTYPKELIDAYINGQFVNLTSGTVYYTYNRQAHESQETIRKETSRAHGLKAEPLYIGMDFNVGNMAAVIYVVRQNGWHAVAELKKVFDTPEMVRIIKERYKDHPITVYPDASGDSRKSVDASKSDIALLQYAGFSVRANKVNPFVKDRVLSVNKQLEKNMLWVNSKECPVTASCLEQQSYDPNGEPDKSAGFDHQNDAFGYPIAYEFPVVKPYSGVVLNMPRKTASMFAGY